MQRIVHKNGRRIDGKDQAELSCIFVDILYDKFFSFSSLLQTPFIAAMWHLPKAQTDKQRRRGFKP
jgi:hypothetical protein